MEASLSKRSIVKGRTRHLIIRSCDRLAYTRWGFSPDSFIWTIFDDSCSISRTWKPNVQLFPPWTTLAPPSTTTRTIQRRAGTSERPLQVECRIQATIIQFTFRKGWLSTTTEERRVQTILCSIGQRIARVWPREILWVCVESQRNEHQHQVWISRRHRKGHTRITNRFGWSAGVYWSGRPANSWVLSKRPSSRSVYLL